MAESEEDKLRRLLREAGESVEPSASLADLRARVVKAQIAKGKLRPRWLRRRGKHGKRDSK